MSFIRINHLFYGLMALMGLCAFIIPQRHTDPFRVHIQGLFNPISFPIRRVVGRVYVRVADEEKGDPRAPQVIAKENELLRRDLLRLTAAIERLEKLDASWQKLGDLKSQCTHYAVAGGDSAGRDTLSLAGSSFGGLRDHMPVLHDGGLVGYVERTGLTGARVRLLSDRGFRVTGRFVRLTSVQGRIQPVKIQAVQPLVEGQGNGQLVITLPVPDVELLAKDDVVVLDDNNWPAPVQGVTIGRIISVERRKDVPGFAELKVDTETSLPRLSDVWVMNGGPRGGDGNSSAALSEP